MNSQRLTTNKILFLFGFLTIIFLLLSIIYTPVIDEVLPADPFFFVRNLSVFYLLSLASLLTVLLLRFRISISEQARKLTDVFLICSLVVLIYGAPCFMYSQPVYVDAYIHTSASLKILLQGHTPPPLSMMAASNDPGGYLLFSIFLATTNLDPMVFMHYYPLLISSVLLILLYVASSKLVGSKFAILSPFVFTAFEYTRVFHVYSGTLTYVFYVLFILFFASMFERSEKKLKLLLLLLVASSTVTYVLGAPILLIVSLLPSIPLAYKWVAKKSLRKWTVKGSLISPVYLFVVWVSWLVFLAQGNFRGILTLLQEAASGDTSTVLPATVSSSLASSIRILPLLMEDSITIFLVLSGIAIVILCFLDAKGQLEKNRIILLGGSFISFYLLSVLFLPIRSGSISRFYSLSVLPYCLLVPLFISKAKQIKVRSKFKKWR